MNARNHRVGIKLSPLDFPPISGLCQSSVYYETEAPYIIDNGLVIIITKKYILTDMSVNEDHEILTAQSEYKIPIEEIKSREAVYEIYKDATLGLNEAYQYARTQLPTLPSIIFPTQPIENYQKEIDRVFDLLYRQN